MINLLTYNNIISILMSNDRNATYNDILEDNNNNLAEATEELIEVLTRLSVENDDKEFYSNLLKQI